MKYNIMVSGQRRRLPDVLGIRFPEDPPFYRGATIEEYTAARVAMFSVALALEAHRASEWRDEAPT